MIKTTSVETGLWVWSDAPTPETARTELAAEFDAWNLSEDKLPLNHIQARERKGKPCFYLWGKYAESYKKFRGLKV